MKRLLGLLLVTAIAGMGIVCWAGDTAEVGLTAEIRDILELDCDVYQVPTTVDVFQPGDSNTVAAGSMSFGELTLRTYPDRNGLTHADGTPVTYSFFGSDYYYAVFLYPATSGRPYKLTQELTLDSSDVLKRALVMTPHFIEDDLWWPGNQQDPLSGGDAVEKAKPAGSGDGIIYKGPTGLGRIVRCYYGLATGNKDEGVVDDNGRKVPVDPEGVNPLTTDFGGTHSGTLKFTVVLDS